MGAPAANAMPFFALPVSLNNLHHHQWRACIFSPPLHCPEDRQTPNAAHMRFWNNQTTPQRKQVIRNRNQNHNPKIAPATNTTATAPFTPTATSLGDAAPVFVADAAAEAATLLAALLALLAMELAAPEGKTEVDNSEVAWAAPAEVADAKTEVAFAWPFDRAEERRAPPSEVAEAILDDASPRAEESSAPPAARAEETRAAPKDRAEERSWAEARERKARRTSLVNCIFVAWGIGIGLGDFWVLVETFQVLFEGRSVIYSVGYEMKKITL